MQQTRRTFLATLGTAALGAAAGYRLAAASPAPRRALTRIGLQLYTVRGEMGRDFAGTLARVAAIGYTEVEFAGYFGRSPTEVRELLTHHGLTSPSTHIPFAAIRKEWGKTLADASAIGHQWVTIPWIPEEERRTLDGWKRVAHAFNDAATEARAAGLRFAYHNHDYELKPIGDVVPLDLLLSETDPALVDFEMDLYWLVKAGRDPLDYFARFPKRFPLVHVKDSAGPPEHRMVNVGRGTIDFRRIIGRSGQAGIEHYFVEHDQPTDPMESARESYQYLVQLGPQ
jgi:sugar phosphate isomerase/epimerase